MSKLADFQGPAPEAGQQSVPVSVSDWRKTVRVTFVCLFVWLALTAVPLLIANPMASLKLFGWPAPFAIVAFCVPLAYLVIIGSYCLVMDRLERNPQSVDE